MPDIYIIALISFVASILGTIAGFGTSTVMMPILVILLPLPIALFFVSIIHWFNGLIRVFMFRSGINWKLLLSFGLSGILTSIIGAHLAFNLDEALMKRVLGVVLTFYSIYLILNPKFKLEFNIKNSSLGGLLSGFMAGIFGVGGSIRGAFLAAFNLPKEVYLANSAFILLAIDSARLSHLFLGRSQG